MTEDEFKYWFRLHAGMFDSVQKWLKRQNDSQAVLLMMKMMEGVEPDEARRATEAMVNGELERPWDVGDHARALLGWIEHERRRAEVMDNALNVVNDRITCHTCKDAKHVPVWGPRAILAARRNAIKIPNDIRATRCTCVRLTEQASEEEAKKKRVTYDPTRHASAFVYDQAALRKWATESCPDPDPEWEANKFHAARTSEDV